MKYPNYQKSQQDHDLEKVPDEVLLLDLHRVISERDVVIGQHVSYIQELEHSVRILSKVDSNEKAEYKKDLYVKRLMKELEDLKKKVCNLEIALNRSLCNNQKIL